jgi:predicted nuclease with TOPRIM domain
MLKIISKPALLVKQHMKIVTQDIEIQELKEHNEELKDVIKSDLYNDFMDKLEIPSKVARQNERVKLLTQQRTALRTECSKQVDEIKELKEQLKDKDKLKAKCDKYAKHNRVLKEMLKEGK